MKTANHSSSDSTNSSSVLSRRTAPKILIVEDEAQVAILIRILLYQAGCETEIATSIPEALKLAQEKNFDLITLDVGLSSSTDGFAFCKQLKENPRLQKVPVVFVSGRGSLEDQQHGLDAGAVDYIVKPFDGSEFVTRIMLHINAKAIT
jgi:DNA-binding response OmpR family regulator